jgi:carboxyl-terminal processing protease
LVGLRNGRVMVMHPFSNSPAHKAGLRPGDLIQSINGASAEGMTTADVADRLKGPRGTQVNVTVERQGRSEPATFAVTRDAIARKSVQDMQMLKPGIAYLKIDSFNENTSREVNDNLARIDEDRLEGLVLDLRGNPGGLLNEGVAVANEFLDKGQSIVSHRGRASTQQAYLAKGTERQRQYPIVVLVDRYSASAAEIVSGALQDHDRAWILGDTTFGKGLVQSQYPLSNETALLLTTAKYYTPSGRLIQREYSKTSFVDYYYRRGETKETKDVKATDSGRTVFGGGGITPDERFTGIQMTPFQTALVQRDSFFDFSAGYVGANQEQTDKKWRPGAPELTAFRSYLEQKGVRVPETDWETSQDWIRTRLQIEMQTAAFGKEEADRLAVPFDPIVEHAIESLSKAKALMEDSKRTVAQQKSAEDSSN